MDLLFDEDTAFWPALASVSQKAKCPIVLTSSSILDGMSSIKKFQYISLERPSPSECGFKMAEVAKSEGMRFKKDYSDDDDVDNNAKELKNLSLIAEVCQCDIRKILNEMQLFRSGGSRRRSNSSGVRSNHMIDMDNFGLRSRSSSSSSVVVKDDGPSILGVEPHLVPRESHTLITITGKNFSSSTAMFPSQQNAEVDDNPVVLYVGGQVCRHYRVVSDSKILAVCPPCILPSGVSENGIYEGEHCMNLDCLSCKFATVVVRKKCSNGIVLSSSSRIGVAVECTNDEGDSPHDTTRCHWNIEYDIQLRDSAWEEKRSRDEFIRKSKAAQRKRAANSDEDGDGLMSSSDEEEFEKETPAFPPSPAVSREDQGDDNVENDGDEMMDDPSEEEVVEKKEKESSIKKDVDPQTLLDEAIAHMKSCEGASSSPSNDNKSAEVSSLPENQSMPLVDVNRFADEWGRLSDAILLEDSFTSLAIPSISGPVEGFGSHAMESLSSSATTTDPSIDKLCKGKNKKP